MESELRNRAVWALGLLVTLSTLSAQAEAAPETAGSLFISPCGQPFRAGPGQPYPIDAWFEQDDSNHDGVLDQGEMRAEATAFFRRLDQNQDGVIESTEVTRYEREIVPEIGTGQVYGAAYGRPRLFLAQLDQMDPIVPGGDSTEDAPKERGYHPLMVGAAAYTFLREAEPLSASDLDLNGQITLDEYLTASDQRFQRLDANGDGRLSLAELPPTLAQAMTGRSGGPHGRRGRPSPPRDGS
jgi:hypothetical protein